MSLFEQQTHRPAVGYDVVQAEQQEMLLGREPDQLGPHQRATAQIEGAPRLCHGRCPSLLITFLLRETAQIHDRHVHHDGGRDHLKGLSLDHRDARPQGLMAVHDPHQALAQSVDLQRTKETKGVGNVVNGPVGFVLVQEPEPLLCKREGQATIA